MDPQPYRKMERQTERQIDDTHTVRQKDRYAYRQTIKLIDSEIERQMCKLTEGRIDR